MAKHRLGLAVLVSAAFLLFSPAAKAAIIDIDIFGFGTGSLNSIPFTDQPISFHLAGPDDNGNSGIALTTSEFTLIGPGGTTVSFSTPTLINLNFGPDYAFFRQDTNNGGQSTGTDLIRLFFSPSDFVLLANSDSFVGITTAFVFPGSPTLNFTNIATSGGLLSFTSAGNNAALFTSAVPELSTWAMMLLGFAGVGLVAYRRAKKASVAITA